ncbi:unnamed protein product [Ixodes persulcatus]
MRSDPRLKGSTQRAYGKRKRRAWNKSSTASTVTLPAAVSQEVLLPAAASFSPAPGPDTGVDSTVGGSTLRVDTHFFSPDESAERAARVDKRKQELAAKSATERKFDLLNVTRENEQVDSGTQFIIVDLKVLNTFFASTKCGQCGSATPALKKSKGQQYGLAVKLELTCPACDFREEHFSSPRTEGEARITPFEVNMRAVKGIQSIGKGSTALTDFCAALNISHRGLHHKTFQRHLPTVMQACELAAAACEAESVAVVRELYADFLNPANNIDVMYDGTWKKRGRTSHIGVGCIVEVYTGLVIDHIVLCNLCLVCSLGPKPEDEGYSAWFAEHKPECKKNIDCNSGRMEVEAALIMFRRSFEKHGLRYTTVLFDGDSRTYHALTEDAVYGFVEIEKKDCLNHVHKRMGSALRTLVDKKKAQGEALGGKGRLTQDRIKRITNYYGYALRSHSHDVPAMQRAVQATLRHMSSTDESPDHSFCPEGANSWCSYNRALANSEQPRGHKNALPDFVREALEPVFARLGDKDLLERCSDGKTQNPSESLHAVIWAQTSKNTHTSLFSVQRAGAEAVSVFNQGQKKTNESVVASLGYTAGSALIRRSIEKDDRRLHKANKVFLDSDSMKKQLSTRHRADTAQDYSPGLL